MLGPSAPTMVKQCIPMWPFNSSGEQWPSRETQMNQTLSKHIFCSHYHLLGTNPHFWSALCPLPFSADGASNHVLCDRLPPHIDVMSDRVHTTLLQHFIGGWVYPLAIHPPAWCVFLCHPIRHVDVESLKSGHDSRAQDPHLASVQEDRLHDGLVKIWHSPVEGSSPFATPVRPLTTSRVPCKAGSARLGCHHHPARVGGQGI